MISSYDNDYTTFSLPEIINSYPSLCDKELIIGNLERNVVKLTPNNEQLSFKSASISVKNDMIDKVDITDFNDMNFIFELSSIEINLNLSDELFSFNPTEGVEIVDLR